MAPLKKCKTCSKEIPKSSSIQYTNHKNEQYYFCSGECLNKYIKKEAKEGEDKQKGKVQEESCVQTTFKEVKKSGVPKTEGVYLLSYHKKCLYVGRSNDLSTRLITHFRGNGSSSLRDKLAIAPTWKEEDIHNVTIEIYPIEKENKQKRTEKKIIQKEEPPFNGVSNLSTWIKRLVENWEEK